MSNTNKILLVILLFIVNTTCGGERIIYPLGKKAVKDYLSKVNNINPSALGFNPKTAIIKDENKEGSSAVVEGDNHIWVYDVDINNDGKKEYFAIYTQSGSLNTSGILSVVLKEGVLLKHSTIISKSLWNDPSGDMSKFHLWLATPSIVKRNGKIIIRFLDKKPKILFTEYTWIEGSFKKISEKLSNTYKK